MADQQYIDTLNDYHLELVSVAELSAHLLDLVIDLDVPEWQSAACWLMRNRIVELAIALPFPEKAIPVHQPGSDSRVVVGGLSMDI